jgi:hypothetical protein
MEVRRYKCHAFEIFFGAFEFFFFLHRFPTLSGFHGEYFKSATTYPGVRRCSIKVPNCLQTYENDWHNRYKLFTFDREDAFINFPDWDADDSRWRTVYKANYFPLLLTNRCLKVFQRTILLRIGLASYLFQGSSSF